MVTKEPNVSPDERFELRDTARILGVSPSTISKWTAAGKIRCSFQKLNGRRCWRGKDIIQAWRVLI